MIKFNDIISCRALFFISSFYIGLWTIRTPTIKDQLQTDYIGIGYIYASFALGSILIMIFSSNIIKKFSSKTTLLFGGVSQSLLWLLVPFIYEYQIFLIITFLFGCGYGIFEVAINLQASNIEKRENKSMMSSFHAFFSLGILLGSFLTSVLLEFKMSFFLNICIYVGGLLPLTILFINFLQKDLIDSIKGKANIFFFWPMIIFILVLLTITDSLSEGGVDAWAALYMRDAVHVTGFNIGIATISFNFFMVLGRLIGDSIRDLLGIYKYLILLIILSVIGVAIISLFNSILSSIIGFSILGSGLSGIIPLAYSLAGKIKGIDSAVGISIISIAAYGVFMVAPALMGYLAKYLGINYVFSPMILFFCLCLCVLIFNKKKLSI